MRTALPFLGRRPARTALAAIVVVTVVGAARASLADGGAAPSPGAAAPTASPRERFPDGARAFDQARAELLRAYVDDHVADDDLYRAAVAGMVGGAGGRKWDKLLSPSEMADLHADLAGEVVGIGIEIKFDAESGNAVVIGALPGSPAERSGVVAGDRILRIDGQSFKGRELRDVVRAIRGRAGESVTLVLLRDATVMTKSVRREPVSLSPVAELQLADGYALVAVRSFTEKTPALLRAALQRAASAHARGVVLDLRGNAGGLLEGMIDCAGLLLPRGSVVASQIGRGGHVEVLRTREEPVTRGVPIVVLVDGATASGAELLAGALRDHLGVRLVGVRTFGKWNVQRISDLPNGWAMKYTVGVFKTPRGLELDGRGLDPDLEVAMEGFDKIQRTSAPAARLAADAQLRAAVAVLRLTK